MRLQDIVLFTTIAIFQLSPSVLAADPAPRAAIFVENRAQPELDSQKAALKELLAAHLSQQGFAIIDYQETIAKLAPPSEGELEQEISAVMSIVEALRTESTSENVTNSASALRIAQMLNTNYLIIASILSFGQEQRTFTGTGVLSGVNTTNTAHTLRVGLRVLEGEHGGTVYGDIVTTSSQVPGIPNLKIESSEMLNKLLAQSSSQIAQNISNSMPRIRSTVVEPIPIVEFTVKSNVAGAIVALDGAAIGSAPGVFRAKPGIHQISVSKDWYATWQRSVNISDGQTFSVVLEPSAEGMRRTQQLVNDKREDELTRKIVDADIEISKEQSAADAHAKRVVADGQSDFLKDSHIRMEGSDASGSREPSSVGHQVTIIEGNQK